MKVDSLIKKINNKSLPISDLTLKETVGLIEFLNIEYYNNYQSHVSDSVYDALKDYLQSYNPSHKLLSLIDAPMMSRKKVPLPFHMGSMNKIKPSDGDRKLQSWMDRNGVDTESELLWSTKLDGISGALVIDSKHQKYRLYTRGSEGKFGLEVTALSRLIDLPNPSMLNPSIRLRGEFVVSKKAFAKYKSKYPECKNTRNFVGGVIVSKQPNPEAASLVQFVVYEVVEPNNLTFTEQMELIQSLGFDCVKFGSIKKLQYKDLSKLLIRERKESKYGMDGIIVTNNKVNVRNTAKNPDYAFAFKDILNDQKMVATILKIEWNISKDNYLKPKVSIEPTEVGDVTIRYCTAHNAKYVVENGLGRGAVVEIIRSGDVIPKINRVIERSKHSGLPVDIDYYWNETKVDILAVNESIDLVFRRIHYFFSKLKVPNLGLSTVQKIVVSTNYKTVRQFLDLRRERLVLIDGFSEKKATIVIDGIKKGIADATLVNVMVASNVFGRSLGSRKIQTITTTLPGMIGKLMDLNDEEIDALNASIVTIKGFEKKSANLFTNSIKAFQNFMILTFNRRTIQRLFKIRGTQSIESERDINFKNQVIVFSGFRDRKLEEWIVDQGGEVRTTISKRTTILVVANLEDTTSKKVIRAIELGIQIKDRNSFLNKT
jgi:DNA ligase (NAD+)